MSEDESDLNMEFVAINSIYTDCMIQKAQSIYIVFIPDTDISVRLSFPSSYPDKIPQILNIEGSNEDSHIIEIIENALNTAFNPGMVCIYEFIENAKQELEVYNNSTDIKNDNNEPEITNQIDQDFTKGWYESDPIIDRKSIFIGRAIAVSSEQEAESKIDQLKQDRKIAKATHNMTCWRIKRHDGVTFQDSDDDGESAAGGRLLHLMTLTESWNVVVVVSRWYGGVHLGPDRFRHINNCARQALERGGFITKK